MKQPVRTIWDTRVQGVTGILCADTDYGVDIYASATFAEVTPEPPRVIINPNRAFAFADAIETSGRFSINVIPTSQSQLVRRLVRLRRREPHKAALLGITPERDEHDIPFLSQSMRVLFCEVQQRCENGDRWLYIARVLESRLNPVYANQRPLLFHQLSEDPSSVAGRLNRFAVTTGIKDAAKKFLWRLRPPAPADVQQTTYEVAGAKPRELKQLDVQGKVDLSRHLRVPAIPMRPSRSIGICVVGTKWGAQHWQWIRAASPQAKLFVCGQDRSRTRAAAQSAGAEDFFLGLDAAIDDPRVEALSLAVPHHVHRESVERCLAGGKHVLVEKPIATNLKDADAMIAAANEHDRIFMVAENMHYRPAIAQAVHCIDEGLIGEPLHMMVHAGGILRPSGWKKDAGKMGGGVLIDVGVHAIRAMRLLMGEPDRVYATQGLQMNLKMEGEDSTQLLFSSRYGWQTQMLISWASHRGTLPDIVVAGEKGTLAMWPKKEYLEYYPVAPRPITRLLGFVRPYRLQAKLMRPERQRTRIHWKGYPQSAYVAEMQDFLASIAENRQPATLPTDARRDLEIVQCCYRSIDSGEAAVIPSVTASYLQAAHHPMEMNHDR